LRSGWRVVRSELLAKGGTLEKRPPPRLHKVPTQNNEVSLQTFQTALVLRGLCDTTVPNVHTLTADKSDDIKDSSYKELEHVSVQFPKYHMKILLQDFNTKVGREYFQTNNWE
jgi:hypothetical protein